MKTLNLMAVWLLSTMAWVSTPAADSTKSACLVVERGPDWRVLQKNTVEHGTNCVHRYTELASGMHYTNASGQLVESQEQITVLPQGGAQAVQGRHQVYFPADIYNGVLEVVTPDGRHLQSRPLGVSYDDGSNIVWIAQLQHSVGRLTSSNQVTYFDAFTDFKADLVATYRRSGFECDLVFRQQPPTPDQYGLNNANSTLQMVTEFFNTKDPQQIPAASDNGFGLLDHTLKFGQLTMKQGKAFAIKSSTSPNPVPERQLPVYKRWERLQGRTLLIEELPLTHLAANLSTLPLTASLKKTATNHGQLATRIRPLPPARASVADTNQILIAAAARNPSPGVVLDYNVVNTDQSAFTFHSNTTY